MYAYTHMHASAAHDQDVTSLSRPCSRGAGGEQFHIQSKIASESGELRTTKKKKIDMNVKYIRNIWRRFVVFVLKYMCIYSKHWGALERERKVHWPRNIFLSFSFKLASIHSQQSLATSCSSLTILSLSLTKFQFIDSIE